MAICLTPLTLPKKEKYHDRPGLSTNLVPCGRCPNCIKKRVTQWVFRLETEQRTAQTSAFVTLTYSENFLPLERKEGKVFDTPTLRKSDLQKFFKRLRKASEQITNAKNKIKYYAVGEYGGITNRPHYHIILFNTPQILLDNPLQIEQIWGKGNIQVDTCTPLSIRYVTNYVMKKSEAGIYKHFTKKFCILKNKMVTTLHFSRINPDQIEEPEFSIMSKKLGINYITNEVLDYHTTNLTNYITMRGGQKSPLPRYYKDNLYTQAEKEIINQTTKDYINSMEQLPEKIRLSRTRHAFAHAKRQIKKRNTI